MTITEILERIQETELSRAIAESTWGYPIVGALHVLVIALFAGWFLLAIRGNSIPADCAAEVRKWKRAGFVLVTLTGVLLFISQPVHYYGSLAFRIKLVFIALALAHAALPRRPSGLRWIAPILWAATIVASRGIAFM